MGAFPLLSPFYPQISHSYGVKVVMSAGKVGYNRGRGDDYAEDCLCSVQKRI